MTPRLFIWFILVFSGLLACESDTGIPEKATNLIEQIQTRACPDSRTCVFDISIKQTGSQFRITGETDLPGAYQELTDSLQSAGLAIIDSVSILPQPELLADTLGLVNLSVANIRSQPKHSAELSTQALMGMPVRILKQQGDWYYVQTPDDYLGWLDKDGLERMDTAGMNTWMVANRGIFLGDRGTVLSKPGIDSAPVSDLVSGDIMRLGQEENGFREAILPDGRKGWILVKDVVSLSDWPPAGGPNAETLLETARKYVGRPYLWGGTSGKGFDCSGYTKTMFYLQGVIIPRDASQQVTVGEVVVLDSLLSQVLPGDLLFFGRKAEDGSLDRVWHVAFYLGDGYILHAAGRVRIESLFPEDPLYNPDRRNSLVAARRITKESIDGEVRWVGAKY